jgi:hypothetical protein
VKLRLTRAAEGRSAAGSTLPSRSAIAPARETIALVLDENAPLPENDQDILDLVLRLRGDLMQLGHAIDSRPCPAIEKTLTAARHLAATDVPAENVAARVHLRDLATTLQSVITELVNADLVYGHRPECPPAEADEHQAARVRVCRPEVGYSVLCNGVLLFDDTGCLMPSGKVIGPRRPVAPAETEPKAVTP